MTLARQFVGFTTLFYTSWNRIMALSTRRPSSRKHILPTKRSAFKLSFEALEDRTVPSTFSVLNLDNGGAGSLRQALLDANANPGADTIQFDVTGTIQLTTGALPAITGQVDIDGSTAPGFATAPLVEVDYHQFGGLQFKAGSSGSTLRSLSLFNASGAGVKISGAGSMLIVGNYIGLKMDGATVASNGSNGLELINSSNNYIGGTADQDRNTISGNLLNGIALSGSSSNQIVGNNIGTDVTGMVKLGNARHGILMTALSKNNLIGGDETGGNDPTNGVFVRPPEGNLISGNNGCGVLISDRSTYNTLSGNFIGTDATGDAPLGNLLDGVAIVSANNNSLIGCLQTDNPFIYYNVIDSNGGNGLRITNSNTTTVQANFFGLGADNQTPLGNHLNGVLIEGSSSTIVFGGVIPLGNVTAANGLNGILVQGTANRFQSFNTFAGVAAFKDYTNLGNGANGIKITSTGGSNEVRTSVISENLNNGIEISGCAHGVLISENIIGLNTSGAFAMGNKNNGVEIKGNAHDNIIGLKLPTFSVIPHNAISGNVNNGIAVTGNAYNNRINFSFIGTDIGGQDAIGNGRAGVYLGAGTHGTTVGSTDSRLFTVISGNTGNGVEMRNTYGNTVTGCLIGIDRDGQDSLGNGGNGIFISNSNNNVIGRKPAPNGTTTGLANHIAYNAADGVFVASGSGNGIRSNSIFSNGSLGIELLPGANKNQAAPVLSSVQVFPVATQIMGTLHSTPNSTFTIEFFANDANEPSGQYFLGSTKVKTNGSGNVAFTFNGLVPPNNAQFFTATATSLTNNTSEFSEVLG